MSLIDCEVKTLKEVLKVSPLRSYIRWEASLSRLGSLPKQMPCALRSLQIRVYPILSTWRQVYSFSIIISLLFFLNKHKILKLKRFQTFFKRNFGILFWLIMKTLRCMMWKLFDTYGHSVDLSIGRKWLYDCFCLHGLYSFSLISKLITHNIKINLKNCFLKINISIIISLFFFFE